MLQLLHQPLHEDHLVGGSPGPVPADRQGGHQGEGRQGWRGRGGGGGGGAPRQPAGGHHAPRAGGRAGGGGGAAGGAAAGGRQPGERPEGAHPADGVHGAR